MVREIVDIKNFCSITLLMALLLILIGCGAGKTMVTKPAEMNARTSTVEISETNSTVNLPDEVRVSFREKLSTLLYEEGDFEQGPGLKIEYRFIQFNPGSQFKRWFWGGIGNSGEGTMTVEAKYFDSTGNELAVIQSEGKINSGFFGGSIDFAIKKTAEEIANYTKANFLK
jgi:hypothetical protein